MPELLPTYQRLVELAGGDDVAARMLTLWNLPRFSPGCSQLAVPGPAPLLCRNYDYSPELFEYTVISSRFTGRRVLGTGDCLWGLLDGMNEAGLAMSLAFGGRPGSGRGFAIPLVLRYLLEVCTSTDDVRVALRGLPVAMSYNVTVVDAAGNTLTVYLDPDEPAEFTTLPLATNHRGEVPEFAQTRPLAAQRGTAGDAARDDVLVTGAGRPGDRVPLPAAVQHRLLPGVRHPLHRAVPAGLRLRRLLLAGSDLAPALRRPGRDHADHLPRGRAHPGPLTRNRTVRHQNRRAENQRRAM